jgi:hypothetical protein
VDDCVELGDLPAMQTLYHAGNGNVVIERTLHRAGNHSGDGQTVGPEGTAD